MPLALPVFIDIQHRSVLNQSNGVIQASVPSEIGADRLPDNVGQSIIRPVEQAGVVNEGIKPLFVLLVRRIYRNKIRAKKVAGTSRNHCVTC